MKYIEFHCFKDDFQNNIVILKKTDNNIIDNIIDNQSVKVLWVSAIIPQTRWPIALEIYTSFVLHQYVDV